jgi:hypothetical protein
MTSMPEPTATAAAPRHARPRPVTLYILVALIVTKSILVMLALLGAFTNDDIRIGQLMRMPNFAAFIRETPGATAFLFLLAATLLVSALLLLADRRVGWLLAMVITGVSVAVDIVAFVSGTGSEIWMFLNVVTVFYLNQRDIRERVGATLEPMVDLPPQAGS